MAQHNPEDTVKAIRQRKPEPSTTVFRAKARSTQCWNVTMMISTFLIAHRLLVIFDVEKLIGLVEKLLPTTYFHLLAVFLIGACFLVSVFYGTSLLPRIILISK
jgi:hypothetical protein